MPKVKKKPAAASATSATIGYEAQLWQMADALRGSMDAAEYKHVTLGLLFLKYISDAFEEKHAALLAEKAKGADPEDPDEYRAQSIFWVPPEARWQHLKAQARQATVGQLVDDAMAGIERDNPALKGVLPKDYARPALDKQRLGQLIDMISNIQVGDEGGMALLEGVRDVFEEDEAEDDVLVLGGVHAAAQGVGHLPELSFVANGGASGAVAGLLVGGSCHHTSSCPAPGHNLAKSKLSCRWWRIDSGYTVELLFSSAYRIR